MNGDDNRADSKSDRGNRGSDTSDAYELYLAVAISHDTNNTSFD